MFVTSLVRLWCLHQVRKVRKSVHEPFDSVTQMPLSVFKMAIAACLQLQVRVRPNLAGHRYWFRGVFNIENLVSECGGKLPRFGLK